MITDRQRGSAGARTGRRRSPTVLSLGVGDCTMLLSEVKPQLTFVSEVKVTLFTLKGGEKKDIRAVFLTWPSLSSPPPIFLTGFQLT